MLVLASVAAGAAAAAGIRPGDLLVSLGSYWVMDVDQVGALLAEVRTGDPVEVGFRRALRARLYRGEARVDAR